MREVSCVGYTPRAWDPRSLWSMVNDLLYFVFSEVLRINFIKTTLSPLYNNNKNVFYLQLLEDAAQNIDDIFSLVDSVEEEYVFEKPYDITKEYDHPYHPVSENEVLPDIDEINDKNRQQYAATSIMEMALRKHNGHLARKFRGRFRK